jgi:protoporphyrinogen/coproporphyrinogen III oxidase
MGRKTVIVMGAGIAGLVAARRLAQAGHAVRVLEAEEEPGGRVGERNVRGIRFNAGARLLYAFSPPFNALIDEIGLTPALVPVHHLSADCVSPEGSWTVELMPGLTSLLTPGLSLAERLRFVPFGLRMLVARFLTDPDDASSAAAADDTSLADYVRRTLGPGVLHRMIDPVFRGTRCWNAEDISAAFFATTAPHLVGRGMVNVLAGGMGRLHAALAEGIAIDCGSRVTRVDTPGLAPCSVTALRGGKEVVHEADLVICAVEGSLAASLFPDIAASERAFLTRVRYNSLGIVHYRLNRDVEPAMKFFTRDAAGPVATWQQIPGDKSNGLAPQLYAQLSPEAVNDVMARGMTDRLHEVVADRVRRLYPELDRDCDDLHNQWIARKLPVFYPGYARAVTAFRDRQSAERRSVYFCGDYLAQSLVTGAAASGARAARDVIRHWGNP